MQCTNCNHTTDDPEALFCSQCGKSLCREGLCLCCGKPLKPTANFCDRCGAAAGTERAEIVQLATARQQQTEAESNESSDSALREIIKDQITEATNEALAKQQEQETREKYGFTEEDWVAIQGGTYYMGSPDSELDRFENESQHQVQVNDFEIMRIPVTFDMFDTFCDDMRHSKPADEAWGRGNRPVVNVNYWSAMEYCYWLSKRTGHRVRLPTEAEWEYACRAGTSTPFWTGETITTDQANFDGNFTYAGSEKGFARGKTTPVDTFEPNPWGLHDMHGNVWEWCASVFDDKYTGLESEDAGFDQDEIRERVVRGGSFHNVPGGLRSASRNKMRPNYHYLRIGFRLVRETEH